MKCQICSIEFEGWKTRKYCSRKCYAQVPRVWLRGVPKAGGGTEPQHRPGRTIANVGYNALHTWVRLHKGRADKCADCGYLGNVERGRWNLHYANVSGEYLRDLSDFIALCARCHGKRDKTERSVRKIGSFIKKKFSTGGNC